MRIFVATILLLAAAAVSVVYASSSPHASDVHNSDLGDFIQFSAFISRFGKTYESQEVKNYRFGIFRENLARADALNVANGDIAFGITQFSDLTPMEFKRTHLTYRPSVGVAALAKTHLPVTTPKHVVRDSSAAAQPTSDWRKKNAVTPVKDQGQCGSCWAFSVTEEIESAWYLAGNELTALAPQQVVSCDTAVDQGCNGGDTVEAYKYLSKTGLQTEESYPYVSGGSGASGTCNFDASKVATKPIGNWTYATPNCIDSCEKQDEATLAANVAAVGPASICVAADTWQSYTGGIIRTGCASAYSSLDHCVQLVGLETKGADTYWLVRNSWGSSWGEAGYIYLQFGSNLCGVADEATFVSF